MTVFGLNKRVYTLKSVGKQGPSSCTGWCRNNEVPDRESLQTFRGVDSPPSIMIFLSLAGHCSSLLPSISRSSSWVPALCVCRWPRADFLRTRPNRTNMKTVARILICVPPFWAALMPTPVQQFATFVHLRATLRARQQPPLRIGTLMPLWQP